MHSGIVSVVLFVSAMYIDRIGATEVDFQIASSGYCSKEYLKLKGVNTTTYKNKVVFDPSTVTTHPKNLTIPGCFRLKADNVKLLGHVKQLTVEFEMRIGSSPDPSKPVLECKKKQPKCGCGEKDACMYCDASKNFKKLVVDGKVNNKDIDTDTLPSSCDTNVTAGNYNVDFEVCTPKEEEIAENMPAEVLNAVTSTDGEKQKFSLVTAMYIYDFRYNSLANSKESDNAAKALKRRKARGLIGCYIIISNIQTK